MSTPSNDPRIKKDGVKCVECGRVRAIATNKNGERLLSLCESCGYITTHERTDEPAPYRGPSLSEFPKDERRREIILRVRWVAYQMGKIPTKAEVGEYGGMNKDTINNYFETMEEAQFEALA